MKKAIKWISIVAGVLLALLIIGAIAIPFVFPLEKIKGIATKKISETINRQVKIAKVSFNIFSGIKLEKLTISNRKGFAKKPFVSADAIELRYAFWPIFRRQLIVKELRLVKPEILIEKSSRGDYNFSDLTQMRPQGKTKAKGQRPKAQGFSMIIDTFSIKKARITYIDYGLDATSEIKNANLAVSGITLALIKPINLKFSATANYKGKNIPVSLAGKIGVDLPNEAIKISPLSLGIAGEKAAISATVSRFKAGPSIDFSISSKKLNVDPLVAVFAGTTGAKKPKPKRGEVTKTVNKAMAGLSRKLRVTGNVNIDNLTFQNFKIDRAKLGLSLANKNVVATLKEIKIYDGALTGKVNINLATYGLGYRATNLKLTNFNASPFSNAVVETYLTKLPDYKDLVNKVYGRLDANVTFQGRGVEVPDIMANAVASGSFTLKNGELKRLKSIDAISDKLKTSALKQDLKVSKLTAAFTMRNQVITIKDLFLQDHDVNVKFNGGLDLARLVYVRGNRLTLKGSPRATKGLSREYNLFRDDKGWLELTVELKGNLKKPIPVPILEKPIEKAVEKLKIKIEAKKIEIEEKAKEEATKKIEAEKERLKEEGKKKLKELIKF